jgi:hypothetical protein
MMSKFYDMLGKEITLEEWALMFESGDDTKRRVAYDVVGGVTVSTVLLGVDHNFFGEGPPIIFETMIFGGRYDEYQERYATLEQARAGHDRALKLVLGKVPFWKRFLREVMGDG